MSSTTGTADAPSDTRSRSLPDRASSAGSPEPASAVENSTPAGGTPDTARSPKRRSRRARPEGKRRWRLRLINIIPAVLALAGLALFSYPSVASWFSQYNQSKVVADYEQQVDNAKPAAEEQLAQAHAYNDALSSGAVLEANTNIPTGAGEHPDDSLDYNKILSANAVGLMGRLRIPTIDLDLPIYHGTSDEVLLAGLGHLQGTSLPVGGKGTRSVITGHRGLANATMFTNLDKVGVGDTFTLEVFGEVLSYQVVETKVVAPEETEALRADPDRDLVTLVTCTPLGINTHRILVTAERITPTPADDLAAAGAKPDVPGFPWWAVWISGVVIAVGLYLWRTGYPPKAAAAKKDGGEDGKDGEGGSGEEAPAAATLSSVEVASAVSLHSAATPEDPDAGPLPRSGETWSAPSPDEVQWTPLSSGSSAGSTPSADSPDDPGASEGRSEELTSRVSRQTPYGPLTS